MAAVDFRGDGPSNPNGAMYQRHDQAYGYTYTLLSEVHTLLANPEQLRATRNTISVYAVVAESTMPRMTRGTDFMVHMRIVDPSEEAEGIPVLVFCRSQEQCPIVRRQGVDIVRFNRITVNEFEGRPQLVARIGRPTSYLLFDGSTQGSGVPYQSGPTANYTLTDRELLVLEQLRGFSAGGTQPVGPAQSSTKYLKQLRGLKEREFCDIICRVLAKETAPEGQAIVYVWDGTDAPPRAFSETALPDADAVELQNEAGLPGLPEEATWDNLRRRIMPLAGFCGGHVAQAEFLPLLGSALPVNVVPQEWDVALPDMGQWVKLRNVGLCVVEGQWQAIYYRNSKWAPWHADELLLLDYQERLVDNRTAEWAPRNASELGARVYQPETGPRFPNVRLHTLREVLVHSGKGASIPEHRCLVRVLQYRPMTVQDMCLRGEDVPVTNCAPTC